jgi:hypothetical protein
MHMRPTGKRDWRANGSPAVARDPSRNSANAGPNTTPRRPIAAITVPTAESGVLDPGMGSTPVGDRAQQRLYILVAGVGEKPGLDASERLIGGKPAGRKAPYDVQRDSQRAPG